MAHPLEGFLWALVKKLQRSAPFGSLIRPSSLSAFSGPASRLPHGSICDSARLLELSGSPQALSVTISHSHFVGLHASSGNCGAVFCPFRGL